MDYCLMLWPLTKLSRPFEEESYKSHKRNGHQRIKKGSRQFDEKQKEWRLKIQRSKQ
jgi:hypothetical protein